MSVTLKQVRVGSIIQVRGDFGSGPIQTVTVLNVENDIKNGRPGIDYNNSWAYLSQVEKVIKY